MPRAHSAQCVAGRARWTSASPATPTATALLRTAARRPCPKQPAATVRAAPARPHATWKRAGASERRASVRAVGAAHRLSAGLEPLQEQRLLTGREGLRRRAQYHVARRHLVVLHHRLNALPARSRRIQHLRILVGLERKGSPVEAFTDVAAPALGFQHLPHLTPGRA